MQVHYTRSLKASAREVVQIPLPSLVAKILISFGIIAFYEWLHSADVGKVYFDVDGKASELTAQALLDSALTGVRIFLDLPPDAPLPHHVICESHGGNKLSFRIFLPGYKMVIGDQKRRLERLGSTRTALSTTPCTAKTRS